MHRWLLLGWLLFNACLLTLNKSKNSCYFADFGQVKKISGCFTVFGQFKKVKWLLFRWLLLRWLLLRWLLLEWVLLTFSLCKNPLGEAGCLSNFFVYSHVTHTPPWLLRFVLDTSVAYLFFFSSFFFEGSRIQFFNSLF